MTHLTIEQCSYQQWAWPDCQKIRKIVFIVEQHVPDLLEWDVADVKAIHLLVRADARPVACARVLPDGHIGRMAVLKEWRGRGVGAALLQYAVNICRELPVAQAQLSAQSHAIGFYARAGFIVCSSPYLDANIPHVDMVLKLV
ncbi:GNAT family N-acetyltransferase [Methylophilus aquaticus]|uniref:GNAT family N-acetyltransferase n=1 Tax=Methylophilus aquaticus TaxID=1971610 RepID=UPI0027955B51|nr:GNAT family N-acetyltransferase [Methylophilus aquaticus]